MFVTRKKLHFRKESQRHETPFDVRSVKILIRLHECQSCFFMRTSKTEKPAQADLSLRWAHIPEGVFLDIAVRFVML